MTVGPISWRPWPGEVLERVMAVLVAQDEPDAMRRTPSQGDGGVDLMIPMGDGWHVRQIKGFADRIGSNEKRQIRHSFEQVRNDPRLGKPIVKWTLTAPIDITSGEQAWFEELTVDAPFPCTWDGQTYWDGMAAKHPHVIDYYFRDGRARVEDALRALVGAATTSAGSVLKLRDVEGHIANLRVLLNREDPHYRYEFSTTAAVLSAPLPPDVVAARSQALSDGGYLNTMLHAKYPYALQDAPIDHNLKIVVHDPARGIDIREDFEGFALWGRPLELPEGAIVGEIVAPGDFGGPLGGASGRIGPMLVGGAPERSRLQVVAGNGSVLAELRLKLEYATGGELGGVEIVTKDEYDVLRVTFRRWPGGEGGAIPLDFTLTTEDIRGRPVMACLPVVSFLSNVVPGNRIVWHEEFGSGEIASVPVQPTDDAARVPSLVLPMMEDLAVVQSHVRGVVAVPMSMDSETHQAVRDAAELIRRREIVSTWTEAKAMLREGVSQADLSGRLNSQDGGLYISSEMVLEIDDQVLDLGVVSQIVYSVRVADEQEQGEDYVRLVAGADPTVVHRLGPLTDDEQAMDDAEAESEASESSGGHQEVP